MRSTSERGASVRAQTISERRIARCFANSKLGAVEGAFDDENSYIIVELIAAIIGCSVIDIAHEVLGGERSTAEHGLGKALHAEFFAKPVLCLSDAIGIENQHVAAGKVS